MWWAWAAPTLHATVIVADGGMSVVFYAAQFTYVAGFGLQAPTVAAMVGSLYEGTGAKREGGYTLMFMAAMLGFIIRALVSGTIASRMGWIEGLASTGLMTVLAAVILSRIRFPATGAEKAPVDPGDRLPRLPGRRPFDNGDLLNRAGALAPSMPGYASTLLQVGTGLAMVVGSLAALLYIHWLFVAVWAVGVGLLALLARRFIAVLSAEQSGYEELIGRMVNAYTDALAGRRTIRAAGTVDREIDRGTQPLPALAATFTCTTSHDSSGASRSDGNSAICRDEVSPSITSTDRHQAAR